MKLAISGVKFGSNSLIFSQKDGISMGSPLGPTLANIFMGCIKLKVIPAFKKIIVSKVCWWSFCFFRNEKTMDECFNILDNAHKAINFTIEKEKNNELAFLDVLVKWKENRFLTTMTERKLLQDVI